MDFVWSYPDDWSILEMETVDRARAMALPLTPGESPLGQSIESRSCYLGQRINILRLNDISVDRNNEEHRPNAGGEENGPGAVFG